MIASLASFMSLMSVSVLQHSFRISSMICLDCSSSHLNNSAGISSGPGALLFFSFLIASSSSFVVISLVSTSVFVGHIGYSDISSLSSCSMAQCLWS